jgi:uncharacterized protein YndB with AHSA1/START domain
MVASAKNELKVTRISDREAELTRIFDAPRELLFRTMMDPELIPQWWGPRKYTTAVDKMEPRVGGKYRFVNRAADGGEHWFNGEYKEIVPNERVVQTFEYEPLAGHISVDTMTLEDLGDGRTLMRVRSRFATKEDAEGMLQSGMEEGARETYDRLEEILIARKGKTS